MRRTVDTDVCTGTGQYNTRLCLPPRRLFDPSILAPL